MIDFDMRKLTDKLVKAQATASELPQIAQQAKAESLGHAIIGLNRSVYETAPGAYQRSHDLMRGLHTSGRATRFTATVSVWNAVAYAEVVETGSGPHEMTPAQIIAQARAHPEAPTYLGRTGRNHTLPGPSVYPSAVFAGCRMGQLFAEKVRKALR